MAKRLPREFNCAVEFALEVLGGKWKTVILCYLKVQPLRYAELRHLAPRLSDKMLTERLKDLQETGLVAREKSADGKADVYTLTPRGRSLQAVLGGLDAWGTQNAPEFAVKVGHPLARLWELQPESRRVDVQPKKSFEASHA